MEKLIKLEIRLWIWCYQTCEAVARRSGRLRPVVAGLANAVGFPVDAIDATYMADQLRRRYRHTVDSAVATEATAASATTA